MSLPRVLVIVPAKASSRRVESKNTRLLGGLPLFLWTVRAAVAVTGYDLTVVVSTDDGEAGDEIARLALADGATVIRRPPELCQDPAQVPDVAIHALEQTPGEWDAVVLLLPTSPFRATRHVEEALALHLSDKTRSNVVSVTDRPEVLHKLCGVGTEGRILCGPPLRDSFMRRIFNGGHPDQGAPVSLNGAIWITTPYRLLRTGYVSAVGALPYYMDEESGIDLDTPLDFDVAETILRRREWADRRPFGHNEVAAACRAVLEERGLKANENDWLIYGFAKGYNGARSPGAARAAFVGHLHDSLRL